MRLLFAIVSIDFVLDEPLKISFTCFALHHNHILLLLRRFTCHFHFNFLELKRYSQFLISNPFGIYFIFHLHQTPISRGIGIGTPFCIIEILKLLGLFTSDQDFLNPIQRRSVSLHQKMNYFRKPFYIYLTCNIRNLLA